MLPFHDPLGLDSRWFPFHPIVGRKGGWAELASSVVHSQRYDHTFSTEFLLFLPTTLPITLPEDGRHSLGCFRPALTPATPHFPEDDDEEAIHSNSMSPARRLVVVFKPFIRIASCRPRVVRSGEESEKKLSAKCRTLPPPYTTEDLYERDPRASRLEGQARVWAHNHPPSWEPN